MKKMLLIVAAVFLSATVFAGSARERTKRITFEFEGNQTTGYNWTYTMVPEGIVREVSAEYKKDKNASGRAGAGGRFVFMFEGLAQGETVLNFQYSRPWEGDAEPAKTEIHVLKVGANGKIFRQ
ncbi:protease inhibitor I42 family protein [Leadbettera azotonutricia]|uniref:Chagasin peptidase inhibitor I42 superfamily n=1 Tax=Leadbettera azotonutricia (strain ATCC BAA-888 / DSM 13862 / ZAS-9) TaxID=545695 RepID=F5YCS7_LEAAZ|nr:protease inhibitor I42 family protein [Leadbettera azotonutricia]AEF81614.1 chagasin peptidase inhibitor I42 superfamily [Leadbettera azotonutricia ZAS-9]